MCLWYTRVGPHPVWGCEPHPSVAGHVEAACRSPQEMPAPLPCVSLPLFTPLMHVTSPGEPRSGAGSSLCLCGPVSAPCLSSPTLLPQVQPTCVSSCHSDIPHFLLPFPVGARLGGLQVLLWGQCCLEPSPTDLQVPLAGLLGAVYGEAR